MDARSLRRDGVPWLPTMGEFHYARYPEHEWREELLKMKAGGIDVVATYVFWIHHEEVEGRFRWEGQRSLRRFVETCGELGLNVVVRTGPWCHGEVRNGGLPDWLLAKSLKIRSDDPRYLDEVRTLYGEIAAQVRGLLFKDGGPVIGVQLENEYAGPAEHLLTLKRMAREAGLDVPLYTRTGWPALGTKMPPGEILPLFGGYAEGFWDRSLLPMPGEYWREFLFEPARVDAAIATDQLGAPVPGAESDAGRYPYLTCELGGGMMCSYHRRILIRPEDVSSIALTKVGSGSNLPGYYMYHGGTNPEGELSTLQESQATKYWNDLPVKTYDFQAPLGEFGQVRKHYHQLRRLHLFLRDFGARLATMRAVLPAGRPASAADTSTLRWAVRSDGEAGFLFVNNYHRLQSMPAKDGVQFELRLADGVVRVPERPVRVPADSSFFWPVNLDLAGPRTGRLVYATAQPVARVDDQGVSYVVFAQTPGVPTEFVFDAAGLQIEATNGQMTKREARLHVAQLQPGLGAAIRLRAADGSRIAIVLLDETQSLGCWKGTWQGRERIFLTSADLVLDGAALRLRSDSGGPISVAVLPAPPAVTLDGSELQGKKDGEFRRFSASVPPAVAVKIASEPVQAAGPARVISLGGEGVAEAPTDADFVGAAVWRIRFPEGIDTTRDLLLRVRYVGDVARVYLDGRLLTDNFYNGNAFEIGLKRFSPEVYHKELLLKILPLRKDAPILLDAEAKPDFAGAGTAIALLAADVVETQTVELKAR